MQADALSALWAAGAKGMDLELLRHQVFKVPPAQPPVTEYQLHRIRCGYCGIATCGQLLQGVS